MSFQRASRLFSAVLSVAFFLALTGMLTTAHAQTVKLLYKFDSSIGDPINPDYPAVIAQGRDGNMYSSIASRAANADGAVFKFSPAGVETIVHNFLGDLSEGHDCLSGLTLGRDGNFYGSCVLTTLPDGVVYKVTPTGTYTLVHHFPIAGTDGLTPYAPPIQAIDGSFYGTTLSGIGVTSGGVVYKVTSSGAYTIVYKFLGGTDGAFPTAPLLLGSDGMLYGTTRNYGGSGIMGTIFKMTTAGKLKVVHGFVLGNTDGNETFAALIQGKDGNYYGCNSGGGSGGSGVVFKFTPSGTYTILHHFASIDRDGGFCQVALTQATDGNLYGVTPSGGVNNQGVVFKVTPSGVYSVLYSFDGKVGYTPASSLLQNTNGLFYGLMHQGGDLLNEGTIYSLNLGAAPFIKLELTSGKAGAKIGIFGQGFLTATGVTFGGVPTTFTALGDNYMTVTVPVGGNSGSVVVNMPSGNLTSSLSFKLNPVVLSFTPPHGPVGTVVTIIGTGLLQTTKVSFGGVAATSFTVNSGTQITVTVPTGAKTGKIAVTTPGGTATSPATFTVG